MSDIARLDIEHRIGDTFGFLFSFRQTDGTLRSFAGATAIFHAQSGATTFHLSSATDSEVSIVDVPDSDTGPGGVDCGIEVRLPYTDTETWTDGQVFFYELKEWTDAIGTERYTLTEGNITASLGVVDGSD